MNAKLSIVTLSNEAISGDSVFVGVVVDSNGASITGVDVILNTVGLKPIAYLPTSLIPNKVFNDVGTNRISFSQLFPPTDQRAVNGLIAVLELKAEGTGESSIKFDFTLGATTDTNVAVVPPVPASVDILTEVQDGVLTIK